jgi:hypothetical protein
VTSARNATPELERSERDVEENKHSLGHAIQQALKAELMACLLIEKRVKA